MTLTFAQRASLMGWIRANLFRAGNEDLTGFVADLGGDVEAIIADVACDPDRTGKRAHMADKGRPMPRVEPVGFDWASAEIHPDDREDLARCGPATAVRLEPTHYTTTEEAVERWNTRPALAAARAEEREKAARIAETLGEDDPHNTELERASQWLAAAIRTTEQEGEG